MAWEDNHFYAVTTKHGSYQSFHTLEEAQNHANQVMIGYLEGRTVANDPKPTVIKIQEIEQIGFNQATKTTYKRTGGASFGSYRDHDCYK